MMKVKICGLTRSEDIDYVNELLPDYIGFVFVKSSKRYISPEGAKKLRLHLSDKIKVVGVFVNEPIKNIISIINNNIIDIIQLHGEEDNTYINEIKKHTNKLIIKAFRIDTTSDIVIANSSAADIILLDNGNGGTGETFDWSLLSYVNRDYILAGGLSSHNVGEVLNFRKLYCVDTSSGVEVEGIKNYEKIKEFIYIAKCADKIYG